MSTTMISTALKAMSGIGTFISPSAHRTTHNTPTTTTTPTSHHNTAIAIAAISISSHLLVPTFSKRRFTSSLNCQFDKHVTHCIQTAATESCPASDGDDG